MATIARGKATRRPNSVRTRRAVVFLIETPLGRSAPFLPPRSIGWQGSKEPIRIDLRPMEGWGRRRGRGRLGLATEPAPGVVGSLLRDLGQGAGPGDALRVSLRAERGEVHDEMGHVVGDVSRLGGRLDRAARVAAVGALAAPLEVELTGDVGTGRRLERRLR